MNEEQTSIQVSWDKVGVSNKFVSLPDNEDEKVITITCWKLYQVEKYGESKVEFDARVVKEDGEAVEDKKFTTLSHRLLNKLKEILKDKDPMSEATLSIIKMGEGFDTQYRVKEITE